MLCCNGWPAANIPNIYHPGLTNSTDFVGAGLYNLQILHHNPGRRMFIALCFNVKCFSSAGTDLCLCLSVKMAEQSTYSLLDVYIPISRAVSWFYSLKTPQQCYWCGEDWLEWGVFISFLFRNPVEQSCTANSRTATVFQQSYWALFCFTLCKQRKVSMVLMLYCFQIFIYCDKMMQKLLRVTEAPYLAFCLQPPAENAALSNFLEGTKTWWFQTNQNQHNGEPMELKLEEYKL